MYLSVFIKWLKDVSLSMFIKGFHLWTNDAWVCSSFFTLFFLTDRYEVFCSTFQQVNTWMVVSEMTLDCETHVQDLWISSPYSHYQETSTFNYCLWPRRNIPNPLTGVYFHWFPAMHQFSLIFYLEAFHFLIYICSKTICQWYRLSCWKS